MQPIEALQGKIEQSELGREWINDPLINKDIWALEELGYEKEELKIIATYNIYFKGFSLFWLKLLTKLTVLAVAREKRSTGCLKNRITTLKQLDNFLLLKGYGRPEDLSNAILREFVSEESTKNRQACIVYITRLWTDEGWLRLVYTPFKIKKKVPKNETIPEEVLSQVYENFDLFPPQLERLFRLQLALGCRIGEMIRMPRQCLKQESGQWLLLRWVAKRKHWRFYQIHSSVAELVKEQQKFLKTQLGCNSEFDKLFCYIRAGRASSNYLSRFDAKPVYLPEVITQSAINLWLQEFREKAKLKDKHGNRFNLTSHHFRRTKASIMAYCETEDEYIAAVLGHGSLDMLPHYRKRSLDRLEKEANAKGYVDMYGRVTSFKPRKRRYEKLAELLKVSTPLGECHRPTMLGDCQYRYACLSCDHHRVTLEDKPKLEADIEYLQKDLQQAENAGQERRITEINRLLALLSNRLQGLEKLHNIKENKIND